MCGRYALSQSADDIAEEFGVDPTRYELRQDLVAAIHQRRQIIAAMDRDAMLDSHDTVRRFNRTVPHAVTALLPGVGHSIVGQAVRVLDFLRS